jgi:hypothetical protein
MLYKVSPKGVEAYIPLLRELIKREELRGEGVDRDLLLERLLDGRSFALACFASPEHPIPVFVGVCREAHDDVRNLNVLWVDHMLVPHASELRANGAVLKADVAKLLPTYDRIMFHTNNPALPRILDEIGIISKETARLYEVGVK